MREDLFSTAPINISKTRRLFMKVIYYSEVLNKQFNSEEELVAAEKEYLDAVAAKEEKEAQLKAERTARAKEVEQAYKDYSDAYDKAIDKENQYIDLLNAFIADYGSFHMTFKNSADKVNNTLASFREIFHNFFR